MALPLQQPAGRTEPVNPAAPAQTAVRSYQFLRRAIGVIGLALPWVLALGNAAIFGGGLLGAISDYYYSGMRDVFVGSMCATGVFLFSYSGYTKLDDIASTAAGVGAIGLALFPTTPSAGSTHTQEVVSIFHTVFAGVFFLTLAAFCLYFFTKTDAPSREQQTARKKVRNGIYRCCGAIILVSLLLIGAGNLLDWLVFPDHAFWEEGAAILAFGFAWFVKGDTLFKDRA